MRIIFAMTWEVNDRITYLLVGDQGKERVYDTANNTNKIENIPRIFYKILQNSYVTPKYFILYNYIVEN